MTQTTCHCLACDPKSGEIGRECTKPVTTEATSGHNSVSGERLRSFVKRIEKLEEDKAAVSEDIKEVYAELKGTGFDAPTVRAVIKRRKIELEKRREQDELLALYCSVLGMDE